MWNVQDNVPQYVFQSSIYVCMNMARGVDIFNYNFKQREIIAYKFTPHSFNINLTHCRFVANSSLMTCTTLIRGFQS
jgi:hypothetical protein